MKRKILLADLMQSEPELVEIFEGTAQELEARLLELQEGYCEDEKPVLRKILYPAPPSPNGEYRPDWLLLEAHSDADFYHVARLS